MALLLDPSVGFHVLTLALLVSPVQSISTPPSNSTYQPAVSSARPPIMTQIPASAQAFSFGCERLSPTSYNIFIPWLTSGN